MDIAISNGNLYYKQGELYHKTSLQEVVKNIVSKYGDVQEVIINNLLLNNIVSFDIVAKINGTVDYNTYKFNAYIDRLRNLNNRGKSFIYGDQIIGIDDIVIICEDINERLTFIETLLALPNKIDFSTVDIKHASGSYTYEGDAPTVETTDGVIDAIEDFMTKIFSMEFELTLTEALTINITNGNNINIFVDITGCNSINGLFIACNNKIKEVYGELYLVPNEPVQYITI